MPDDFARLYASRIAMPEDANNMKAKPGDSVILRECPPGLLDDLPTEDQRAISAIIGKPVRLNEYDVDGRAELEFTDADGVIHFLFVNSDIISVV